MTDSTIDGLFLAFQEALVGRYFLERELGRGGMGVVYLAREVRLDRPVAIKLLPPEYAANPTLRERFLREARTAARLSHPYIVPIHAVDEAGDFVFYVMAYVDGETLSERVRARGPLQPKEATRVMREVAWALAYAHAQGVVHRDVKPANILLERGTERALVADFGIARLASLSGETSAGETLGTPEYMSPEQACGEPVDGRSDLYSLGVVGYFALTGTLPFTGAPQEVLAQQVTKAPTPVASVARLVPRPLAAAVDQCLAKDPAARFATGEALAEALASNLEKAADVPVAVRVFLDQRRVGPIIAMPVLASFLLALHVNAVHQFGWWGPWSVVLFALEASLIVIPFAYVVEGLRRVLRTGYGVDDIAAGVRTLHDRKREEFLYEYGDTPSKRERIATVIGISGAVVAVAGMGALALVPQLFPSEIVHGGATAATETALRPVFTMGMYLGVGGLIISTRLRRLRKGAEPLLSKFWKGRVGRMLQRMASVRLGTRAIPADRHTELGIAVSAEALFTGLTKAQKKTLGDVPGMLRDLETHARAMRARLAELDASLADA
ncbi:MAG: serine/threonine-protein kinase, partial [Gemmatimonadaceae bacterium]